MSKLSNSILITAAVVSLAAGVWFAKSNTQNTQTIKPSAIQGAIYPNAKVLNNFNLINQLSVKYTKKDLINHWSLVFVGYTHCPDVCPTTMALMGQITQIMNEQGVQPPQIIFLTVDPERDTAEVLKPYIAYFNENFIGLTGSIKEVSALSKQLNAVFRKAAGSSGKITEQDYLMDHSSALMLINPEGNLQSILTAPHTPGVVIESIINSQAYYEKTHQANN
ncbi:Cytochrome oxidase biogenesis protein Sco1/SenC/PrrC, thiol-disulfide reductase involved in Cu(I) insertion into CoxII Cu(A) center [hydrothermal vent metagenome]|uniref:Cytochrome oxidase biogenesis protein Sco1/SenC/PrrC, thiol-disulfide reductase involved in Cu(I) insertion into CoxII Cu(A) center n=1 Tax=hydrothermal vent metagenome TaxID=652676 RepID=A0A3B0XEP4_9ZZZZ